MDISLNTSIRQEQNLSPQMLQSLALLPMTVLELKTYIQTEIESNPALEIPDGNADFGEDPIQNETSSYDEEASDRNQQAIENSQIKGETLSEHLLSQLGVQKVDSKTYRICELLIGNLDANGFYQVPLATLFENEKFTGSEINKALEIVQSFDPFGICVADFRESLILQAKCSGMRDSDLQIFSKIVFENLEKIKSGKNAEVARNLHISEEDLDTFIAIMKSFTPFPGRAFDASDSQYVEPEFSVHKKNGELVIQMNRSNLPDLSISKEFTDLSKSVSGPDAKEASDYIKASVSKAKTLISQVELRYKTLYSCAQALVETQADFFMDGPMNLKTMTLKDLAEKIGVHETTVSRLAQSKWVDTDWGLFQLKYFFSQGVQTTEGDQSVSRNVVKEHIANILKDNPKLSDQKVSDKLLELGIKCARRTVSKYRAELNIDSSYSR